MYVVYLFIYIGICVYAWKEYINRKKTEWKLFFMSCGYSVDSLLPSSLKWHWFVQVYNFFHKHSHIANKGHNQVPKTLCNMDLLTIGQKVFITALCMKDTCRLPCFFHFDSGWRDELCSRKFWERELKSQPENIQSSTALIIFCWLCTQTSKHTNCSTYEF